MWKIVIKHYVGQVHEKPRAPLVFAKNLVFYVNFVRQVLCRLHEKDLSNANVFRLLRRCKDTSFR